MIHRSAGWEVQRGSSVAVLESVAVSKQFPVSMELFEWDKIYINPLYGKCDPRRDFPALLDHYRTGELKLDQVVTERAADLLAGNNAKVVPVMD